ncbi:MAG: DUF3445 domain-containing protein [Pseudomonadota bacterium]
MRTPVLTPSSPRVLPVPVDGGPFKLSMGLRSLKLQDWLEIDEDFSAYLTEKRRLLDVRHSDVFAALPSTGEDGLQVLQHVAAHVVQRYPDIYEETSAGIRIRPLDEIIPWRDDALHPLDWAGRLTMEDWCLMAPPGWPDPTCSEDNPNQGYSLIAASLCFPTRWRLSDKIGKPMGAIHEPVAGYAERLENPVDKFFSMLAEDRPVWRLNWGLLDDSALFQPSGHERTEVNRAITDDNAGDEIWLRIERQTLRRMPPLREGLPGNILFGIRIHQAPLGTLVNQPALRSGLLTELQTMDEATWRYKSMSAVGQAAIAWLELQNPGV